ncbi:F0F1 ATP synthase subunit I [Acerihabitans arboris]|uniref:F0F1 ATP synthase subunit I n=1 Tax=Acerihabitans arboris TaxID=2691583 RepID=A0A845SSW3_9GAMM|nr:F0F1 ATP synthase subunit I [Acerihabitans arboris]NDL65591.1 F0F1 ATP synthase subunit I [Acerihabitans arboris]
MSLSLYSGKVAGKVLFIQLLSLLVFGALFALRSPQWGVSAVGGGLAAWLPNVFFVLFTWCHQVKVPAAGRVAWSFAIGEALKVVATIALLIVALGMFRAAFVPLGLTYLSVLIVQILAPAVINNKG